MPGYKETSNHKVPKNVAQQALHELTDHNFSDPEFLDMAAQQRGETPRQGRP